MRSQTVFWMLTSFSFMTIIWACDSPAQDQPGTTVEHADAQESTAGTESDPGVSIMEQAMDGSSVEAFELSMARVETEASAADYRKLKNSLEFLLTYDLSVKQNRQKLYAKLDGRTPLQIIEKTGR